MLTQQMQSKVLE